MYKLMIVDDEPLVQVAIKSMLNWGDLGIEICATARNGKEALEAIKREKPDIVITDIKMPVMDGLELIAECRKLYEIPPVFIVLTNYDEFGLVQQALRMDAVDYVIKLELNEQVLQDCIKNAVKKIKKDVTLGPLESHANRGLFARQFLIRLLNGYYASNDHIKQLARNYSLSIEGKFYCVYFSQMIFEENALNNGHQAKLYSHVINMVQEIMSRRFAVVFVPMDSESFAAIVSLNDNVKDPLKSEILTTNQMINNYFNVKMMTGIGNIYDNLVNISKSYTQAMQAVRFCQQNHAVVEYSEIESDARYNTSSDISACRQRLIRSLEEMDVENINTILEEILRLINNCTISYLQALDICLSMLYLLLTVLDSAEEMLNSIFSSEPDGYRCIYRLENIFELVEWFKKLKNGLAYELNKRKNSHSNYLIVAVKDYIHTNYTQKLSLQDVASIFNVSPSYLSSIFKKYTNTSFSNYVAKVKIRHAEEMLKNSDMQIHEISEHLGFSDPYYFSRVFKKITGYYPKEYKIKTIMEKKANVNV
jgi:two-component system response regulator YesN